MMGAKTGISWTDSTWNPIRGCSRVSAGCVNCYAEKVAARFGGTDPRTGKSMPYAGLTDRHGRWNGRVTLVEEHLTDPLRWKKPRRIFVNSMSDLFHENVRDEWRDQIFAVMALASQHTFQVLTKRPERMRAYFADSNVEKRVRQQTIQIQGKGETDFFMDQWPLPNVMLGVSVENQATADERIPLLLETPAAVRFVSYEPALGPIDFSYHGARGLAVYREAETVREQVGSGRYPGQIFDRPGRRGLVRFGGSQLDWIIVGGESGPNARPFDIEWARSTVAQCKEAGVKCFVKQMGAYTIQEESNPGVQYAGHSIMRFKDRAGVDPSEWPEDLRVQEFPELEVRT